MITLCFTYFKSLTLHALAAALFSVRKQDLSAVSAIVVIDNDTADSKDDIHDVIEHLAFPVPVFLGSFKHEDATKTHSWSTNAAVHAAPMTPWILFSRADYLLDFGLVESFVKVVGEHPADWNGFVTANVYHLSVDLARCEETEWRHFGPGMLRSLPGAEADYTAIDAGVWMARHTTFCAVGGLDERLSAWGHAQTHFQHKLHLAGVEFVRIPKPLFFHPQHAAPRDLGLAHQQLAERGVDLKEMWARSHVHPYGR